MRYISSRVLSCRTKARRRPLSGLLWIRQKKAVERPGASLKSVLLYLRKAEGRWIASLAGDITNTDTELVYVSLTDGSATVATKLRPPGSRTCLTKMKDRVEFGYIDCNSAFYSANAGSAAAGLLIRGVLSLGILTATDAATGSTAYNVTFDQQALDAAVKESQAAELAKASAPLVEYRTLFSKAVSSQQLQNFIRVFENNYDPESLVSQAKEKLPAAIAMEESQERQRAREAAHRAEDFRQQQIRQQAETDAQAAFRTQLKPGDRVGVKCTKLYRRCQITGMIVEMKPPLAYVQWENATPNMQWIRVNDLEFP